MRAYEVLHGGAAHSYRGAVNQWRTCTREEETSIKEGAEAKERMRNSRRHFYTLTSTPCPTCHLTKEEEHNLW